MRHRLRAGAIFVAFAASFMVSSCANKPVIPARTDPLTVSSTGSLSRATSGAANDLNDNKAEMRVMEDQTKGGAPFTLETAVQQAVTWHPSVVETVGRIHQQNEVLNEARSGYLPRISWGLNSGYESMEADGHRPVLEVTASQMIYDFGKVKGRTGVATAGIANRKSDMLMAIDNLIRETAYAVIEVQRNNALRSVADDQLRDTSEILKLVDARSNNGASTRSDQLQAKARVQAAEATLLEVQAQSGRWAGVVSNLTGSARGVSAKSSSPKWLASACKSGLPDWSRVPAIIRADAEHAAAAAQLGLSRAEALPTISVDARTGADIMRITSRDPNYTFRLNVSGNLYNGGESGARRKAARYALQSSEAARNTVKVNIARSLTEANAQVENMRMVSELLSKRYKLMNETRNLYRTQYIELGTRTLIDLLNADQEMHASRFDKINIEHDLQKISIDCAYNSGLLREYFSLEGQILHGIPL